MINLQIKCETDKGPIPKLALTEGGSRENKEKLAVNVIRTRPLQLYIYIYIYKYKIFFQIH